MELVDEEDDLTLGGRDLGQHGLQALLELSTKLRSGDQRTDVEGPDALALQPLGHVSRDDPLGEPFGDRRLADAGLSDQDRIVLRPPREHLDRAADLLVASDHRIELAGLGRRREVASELGQRLVRALGILGRHALAASDLLQRAEERVARDELERENEMLDRDEVVVELACLLEGIVERFAERCAGLRLGVRAGDRRQRADTHLGLGQDRTRLCAGPLQQRARQLLLEQRRCEVVARELGVPRLPRDLLRAGDCFSGLDCQLVEIHCSPCAGEAAPRPYGFRAGGCGR